MKQVVQAVRTGELRVIDVPRPIAGPTDVLVQTTHTLISPGTERTVRQLASANLLAKARARPDLVRQVLDFARTSGVKAAYQRVQSRLDMLAPLGYSCAGVVIAAGKGVQEFHPGDRVACAGAGATSDGPGTAPSSAAPASAVVRSTNCRRSISDLPKRY